MKKYLLLSCLFLIINRGVAQDFGAQLLFGTNFSQVDGDQLGGYHKLGLNTGIQINRNIHENWVSAFEIRYSMKGAKKIIDPEAPPTFTLDLKYHYLEVPFLIKYTLLISKVKNFSITKRSPRISLKFGMLIISAINFN